MNQKEKNQLALLIYSPERLKDWRRIARASDEHSAMDVAQEAFAYVLENWLDAPFNFSDDHHWQILISHMYNQHVKFAEKTNRFAQSFDQPFKGDPDSSINPLLLDTKAHESSEPLQQMIDQEEQQTLGNEQEKQIQANSFSMVLAYVEMFERLKPKTEKHTYLNIAKLMKMSYSWLRECLNRAEKLLKTQPSLFDGVECVHINDELRSWRKVKITRDSKSASTVFVGQLNLFQ